MNLGIEATELGARLRLARSAAGLTQQRAATAVDIARTTLVAIEAGERDVRPDELLALADLYQSDVHSLIRPAAVHVDVAAQLRSAYSRSDDRADASEALRVLKRLATSTVELERELHRPLRPSYPVERAITRGRLDQQAEDLALELRARLGLGLSALEDLPALAELELRVRLFIAPLPSRISGVFAYHEELGACIVVNAKHPPSRRTWTLAHELGHFMTSRERAEVTFETSRGSRREEVFANLFANSLLMPATAMRQGMTEWTHTTGRFSTRHLVLMARQYHVSVEAMCRRLEQLDLLPQGTYDALHRKGFNKKVETEIADATPTWVARPSRLAVLGVEALSAGLISEGQLAAMLGVGRSELRAIVDSLSDDTDLTEIAP